MNQRIERVAEAVKEEVAQILQRELKDPRVGFVTVTRVKVSPDLSHATVYFSLLAKGVAREQTESGLKSAQGYIRRLLGGRLRLRVTPELDFRIDPSVEESIRISKLLGETRREEAAE